MIDSKTDFKMLDNNPEAYLYIIKERNSTT